jgi:hypothetical protein
VNLRVMNHSCSQCVLREPERGNSIHEEVNIKEFTAELERHHTNVNFCCNSSLFQI